MKSGLSSENRTIRHAGELIHHFHEWQTQDPDLRWQLLPREGLDIPGPEEKVVLKLDEQEFSFEPIYALKPALPWLETLEARPLPTHKIPWISGSGSRPPSPSPQRKKSPLLLVTPELTPRVLEFCKQHGISAIDLNGRTWLRARGLLVDRGPLPGRAFRYELEPRNIFVGKSARIIRSLLTDRERAWTQAELGPRTGASTGLVSRIVQHLISQGFAEKLSARQFRLRDPLALLDAWAASDPADRLARPYRFASFGVAPLVLAERLQGLYEGSLNLVGPARVQETLNSAIESVQHTFLPRQGEGPRIVFTQWLAAWLRHPYTEPAIASAYVPFLPTQRQLETLSLRPVAEGGAVWLYLAEDEDPFIETQTASGLRLTTDAQIYLDLLRTGLRGPDAAAALRDWEGFGKP